MDAMCWFLAVQEVHAVLLEEFSRDLFMFLYSQMETPSQVVA